MGDAYDEVRQPGDRYRVAQGLVRETIGLDSCVGVAMTPDNVLRMMYFR